MPMYTYTYSKGKKKVAGWKISKSMITFWVIMMVWNCDLIRLYTMALITEIELHPFSAEGGGGLPYNTKPVDVERYFFFCHWLNVIHSITLPSIAVYFITVFESFFSEKIDFICCFLTTWGTKLRRTPSHNDSFLQLQGFSAGAQDECFILFLIIPSGIIRWWIAQHDVDNGSPGLYRRMAVPAS